MKKVIKTSLAAVAALLIFLNVSLNLNGNKVESMNLTTNTQTALADGQCYLSIMYMACYCMPLDYYCIAECYPHYGYDCREIVIEGK